MMTLRHITAAEVRNQQKDRELKREREREGKEPQLKQREGDRNIFHDWIRHCNFRSSNLYNK